MCDIASQAYAFFARKLQISHNYTIVSALQRQTSHPPHDCIVRVLLVNLIMAQHGYATYKFSQAGNCRDQFSAAESAFEKLPWDLQSRDDIGMSIIIVSSICLLFTSCSMHGQLISMDQK